MSIFLGSYTDDLRERGTGEIRKQSILHAYIDRFMPFTLPYFKRKRKRLINDIVDKQISFLLRYYRLYDTS
ncbi:MAG: hypothetical protein C4617_04525 [Candidatus Liberibacter europaeus]|uniref:Uncharacterized protein n=1 Tax=Candidatus Liberibacter europaeus TaxID=744859 RepID=A0A2T4VWW8_9HYPH|nr:hypothetical protein [Candidatus Liberibacter europaeus]PTL86274.1 MAG: hypothetical protein C4617_04525 [Candidatus Liberibacter europaeus]